jgi:hypothetical protein
MRPPTRFRSLPLLVSSFRQYHWRGLFWLTSVVYLAAVTVIALPIAIFAQDGNPRGLFQVLRIIHLGVAFVLPGILAGRLVDDASSGTLQLMQVAGLSPRDWIRFRLLVIGIGYASIWLLRVPFYAFLLHGGGATLADLFWTEMLHTVLAFTVARISLLTATRVELPIQALRGGLIVFYLNIALLAPTGVLFFVRNVWRVQAPLALIWAAEWARSASMFSYLRDVPVTIEGRLAALGSLALHVAIGIAAVLWLRRVLYANSEPGVARSRDQLEPRGDVRQRPSRRVWSNPFFWQASKYYLASDKRGRNAVVVFSLALPVAIGVAIRTDDRAMLVGLWMVSACVTAEMMPVMCAGLELKARTLSSLATLPCGVGAIYLGWKRAGDRYRLAAWLASCVCAAVLAWRNPALAVAWGAVAMGAAWSFPPLTFIETLRSHERPWSRIATSIALGAIGGPLAGLAAFRIPHGILILAGLATLAACLYRPRAIRQMEEEFVRASSL